MNNFQIDMAFKNYKNDVWYLKLAFTSKGVVIIYVYARMQIYVQVT
jgi:hypothetical protein